MNEKTTHPPPPATQTEPPLELSDLQEVTLDEARLLAYLDELHSTGVAVLISAKRSLQSRPESNMNLSYLESALLRREIHGAQLRYVYESTSWVDTLLVVPGGVRLVRMQVKGMSS